MLTPFLVGHALAQDTFRATKWFGPVTATFEVQFPGNPYDPDENDVRVLFVPEKGTAVERLAFFDGEIGAFRAVLVANTPGTYRAILVRNGKEIPGDPSEPKIELKEPLKHGFVHINPIDPVRFRWDDSTPYFPIGNNLGWQSLPKTTLLEQIAKMGAAGENWSRIWACHWDGKNPWWPQDADIVPGQLWGPALSKWDEIVQECDKASLPFQMVFFHHGAFSTKVNPNWQDHPWNVAKGGFLKDAEAFFTDADAKRRTKMWLRYAVARWAHSPSILAWELFNEVQYTDAGQAGHWDIVDAWHKEMADYIRSIDPYKHLVTTSSDTSHVALWASLDYLQPHTYPVSIAAGIGSEPVPKDKPMFFGEFGPSGKADTRTVLRDGLYASLTSGHSGLAQIWDWEGIDSDDLYSEYRTANKVLDLAGIAGRSALHPLVLKATTPERTDLVLRPALGWAVSTTKSFDVDRGRSPALIGLSSYLMGTKNTDMKPGPIDITFRAETANSATLNLAEASKGGAYVRVLLNGKLVCEKTIAPATGDAHIDEKLVVPFQPGTNKLTIENTGEDWVTFSSITLPGLGSQVSVMGGAETDLTLLRLTAVPGVTSPVVSVSGLPLPDGPHKATVVDLGTGLVTETSVTVKSAVLKDYALPGTDVILIVKL